MSNSSELSYEEWQAFYDLLLLNPRVYVGVLETCRCFLNAVLWILRSGGQWRLLPSSLGKWNSVFKVSRWCKRGVWQGLHEGCRQHPDLQHVLFASTIARACAAGSAGSNAEAEALGRSKNGFTTKIHTITDAGHPVRCYFDRWPGQQHRAARGVVAAHPVRCGCLNKI